VEHGQQASISELLTRWQKTGSLGRSLLPSGPNNRISDVPGVHVGHITLDDGEVQTGVTAIMPSDENIYKVPLPCGVAVLNGFAKPIGLTQIEALGVLETPILLTNTLSVGRLFSGTAQYMINHHSGIGRDLPTVNPLILECNDGFLNDIQRMAITEEMAQQALDNVQAQFECGSVGAGRGMSCFSLKGGIGTSSRYIKTLNGTLGLLVLANFGSLPSLLIDGVSMGNTLQPLIANLVEQVDAGSIIIIMATDIALDARQLKRVAARAGAGLGRMGSYLGHGSGDISIAFSTACEPQHLRDECLEPLFCAAAEATESAILNALLQATPITGFQGHSRPSLSQLLDKLLQQMNYE